MNLVKWTLLTLCGSVLLLAQEPQPAAEKPKDEDQKVVVEMVVSASRKPEKKLEAPSTIETINEEGLLNSASTTFSGAAANVKGIDFANGGITLQKFSGRGFSSSYASRMLSMVNGRLSTLPGAGLPQGTLSSTSSLDIKGIEIVLGPASALYGPNASAGVFNVLTKDPWDETGVSVSQKIGEQSLSDSHLRYAGLSKDEQWGWKLTANYLTADEFKSNNVFFVNGLNQTLYTGNDALTDEQAQAAIDAALANGTGYRETDLSDFDVDSKKYEFSGYWKKNAWKVGAYYGWSESDSFGVTNVGRNRIDDWEVKYYQVDVSHPHFFFQWTRTTNFAGKTYSIQNVPGGLAAGVPFETVISDPAFALFYDASTLEDAEFQFNGSLGKLDWVAGANYRKYEPDSAGTYLNDRPDSSGKIRDISNDETGAYVQGDLRFLKDKFRISAALRYDESSDFDSEISPKIAFTYTEGSHNVRLNYNKAHRDPLIIERHLYFFGGIARGNVDGYTVRNVATGDEIYYPGLEPETVETIELGYRGLLGDRVLLDGVVYKSDYDQFISALQTISAPALGTVAITADGEQVPFLLTYLNYGQAKVEGLDIGFDFFLTDNGKINLSYGYQNLKSFENDTPIPDLPFNTPKNKIKGAINWRNLFTENTFVSLAGRYTDSYRYISGRWNDTLESNLIADLALGYTWLPHEMTFKLSCSNLFDSDKTELVGVPAIPRFVTFEVLKKF
ncbi:MAG: TonB-dependent receptor plug domain-containing protein [Acidobacteria bacterium]|nr:TonB-dependent receptor plug domain-containing protein [Acidobacteriota bacterium]